jgi:hypothetical protein
LLAALARPLHLRRALQPFFYQPSNRFDLSAVLDGQIDDVELPFFADGPLRHGQIHQREAAAENFGRTLLLK